MLRIRWSPIVALLFTTSLMALFSYSITAAAPMLQESSQIEEAGQEYVVQRGDWLSRISQNFYGSTSNWSVIVDATNAKAETDSRFSVIDNPDEIEIGQLLWLPDTPTQSASEPDAADETAEETMGETVSRTVQAGGEAISRTVGFVEPQNGDEVPTRFDVAMEAEGLIIEPSGEIREGAGHFHILLDTDFIAPGELLPFDENHLHFGEGQLTTTLELDPGLHTLRLQFSNGAHIALEGEQYQDTITVTVGTVTTTTSTTSDNVPSDIITPSITITEETILPAVHFVEPQNGDEVPTRFDVAMEAEGLIIEPSGEIREGAGHFHILLDTDFIAPGELLPFDENHLHFGEGQLTTTLELDPGLHTLRLQFSNGAHIALEGKQYQDTITVTVAAE